MRALVAAMIGLIAASSALAQALPPMAPVFAVSVGQQGVTLRIALNHCPVEKSDLTVAIAKGDNLPLLLVAPRRAGVHECRAAGQSEITWSYDELGLKPGQPFNLANPLTADPHR